MILLRILPSRELNFANDYSSAKTAGFTLSGARILMDGDIITALPVSDNTIADTISLDMVLSNDCSILAISSGNKKHHIDFIGNIGETGGSRGLTKTGGGYLYLRGDNTYSGKTRLESGTIYFYSIGNIGEGASSLGAPTGQHQWGN